MTTRNKKQSFFFLEGGKGLGKTRFCLEIPNFIKEITNHSSSSFHFLYTSYGLESPPLAMDEENPEGGLASRILYSHFCRIPKAQEDFFYEIRETFTDFPALSTTLTCVARDLGEKKLPKDLPTCLILAVDDIDNLGKYPSSLQQVLESLWSSLQISSLPPSLRIFPVLAGSDSQIIQKRLPKNSSLTLNHLKFLSIEDSIKIATDTLLIPPSEVTSENIIYALADVGGHPLCLRLFLNYMVNEKKALKSRLRIESSNLRKSLLELLEITRHTARKKRVMSVVFSEYLNTLESRALVRSDQMEMIKKETNDIPFTEAELEVETLIQEREKFHQANEKQDEGNLTVEDIKDHLAKQQAIPQNKKLIPMEILKIYAKIEQIEKPSKFGMAPGSFSKVAGLLQQFINDNFENEMSFELGKAAILQEKVRRFDSNGKPTLFRRAEVAGIACLITDGDGHGDLIVHLPLFFILSLPCDRLHRYFRNQKLIFDEPYWRGRNSWPMVEKAIAEFEALKLSLLASEKKPLHLNHVFARCNRFFSENLSKTKVCTLFIIPARSATLSSLSLINPKLIQTKTKQKPNKTRFF